MDQFMQLLVSSEPFAVPVGIEYFFVLVGVFTGALVALERRIDVVGTIALGLVTGYGGGILRDVLLQSHGVYFINHPSLVVVSVLLCMLVFYFKGAFRYLAASITLVDALSVAFFAVAGGAKAMTCGLGLVMSTVLAFVTAIGGGILRDVISGETPAIFKGSNYYAIAALSCSFVFVVLQRMGASQLFATVMCVVMMLVVRYLSIYLDWRTHIDTDLTSKLPNSVRRFGHYLLEHGGFGKGYAERRDSAERTEAEDDAGDAR